MCPLPSVDPGWLVSHLPCVRWYHCCEYRPPAGYFSHRTPAPKLEAEDVSLGGMAMKFASSLFSKKATWQPVWWSDSAFGISVANDPVPIFHQIRKSMQSISLSTYSSNGALINQRTTRLHGSPEKPNEFRATSCWTSARSGRWLSGTAATSLVNLGESWWIWDSFNSWPATEAGTLIAVQRLWKPQVGAKQGPMIDQGRLKLLACSILQPFKKVKE